MHGRTFGGLTSSCAREEDAHRSRPISLSSVSTNHPAHSNTSRYIPLKQSRENVARTNIAREHLQTNLLRAAITSRDLKAIETRDTSPSLFSFSSLFLPLLPTLIGIMAVLLACLLYCHNRKSILSVTSVADFFVHLFPPGHYTLAHEREREWPRSKNGFRFCSPLKTEVLTTPFVHPSYNQCM